MSAGNLMAYVKRQILNKATNSELEVLCSALADAFAEVGAESIWKERISPTLASMRAAGGAE